MVNPFIELLLSSRESYLFDLIVFKRTGNEKLLDAGLFAETLLFYQKVHIVFDPGSIVEFARTIGLKLLVELLSRDGISASFQRDLTSVMTQTTSGIILHSCQTIRVTGDQAKRRFSDREYVESILQRELGKALDNRKWIKKLVERLIFSPLPKADKGPNDILRASLVDLVDESFLKGAVEQIVAHKVPGLKLPNDWSFRVNLVGTHYGEQPEFVVETNLDFEKLNTFYHQRVSPSHSSLSPAYLITFVISAREANYISGKHMSELVIDPSTAAIMRLKYLDLMRKRDTQCAEIDLFQSMVFHEGRAIREVIDSGEKSFAEFLQLLDKAQKFKHFLAEQNPELGLLESYYSEVKKESWVAKLPSKATRIVLVTGLGMAAETLFPTGGIATLLGLGYGVFDGMILEKVARGWRPNQFIDERLGPFVSNQNVTG
jgi:hypothetical protein